jgi:hypothetical protein
MQAEDSADNTADPPRLQPQELKVLAEDIEAAGGIANIELRELLDRKVVAGIKGRLPIYGLVGSKRRRQISNKVDKWKKKESEKYLEILTKLGVVPFADRTRARGTNRRPTAASQNTGVDVEAAEAAIATLNISSQPSSNTNTMSTAKGQQGK